MMKARFEEIHQRYKEAVNDMNSVDLSALRAEIESLIEEHLRSKDEDHKLLHKAEDMLIDVMRMIEETRCRP